MATPAPCQVFGDEVVDRQFRCRPEAGFDRCRLSCRLCAFRPGDSSVLEAHDLAIPILPCRSVAATTEFYRKLGFEGGAHEFNAEYAIFKRGPVELHFFTHRELVPADSFTGCYIRVGDVQSIFQAFSDSRLPETGRPRMDRLEHKPWGLKEFAVVDPDGNLLRIGQVI